MNKFLAFFLLTSILFFGCPSGKELSTKSDVVNSAEDFEAVLSANAFQPEWFSGKAKADFVEKDNTQNFTAHFRMQKDSAIWLMLTGPLGIEGARVLFKPDSIHMLDKLNKKYIVQPYSFLDNFLPFSLGLKGVQQIILGSRLPFTAQEQTLTSDSTKIGLLERNQVLEIEHFVHPKNYAITRIRLKDRFQPLKANFTFDNYREVDGKSFAFDRRIKLIQEAEEMPEGPNILELVMQFSKVETEGPLKFPFTVSDKYERNKPK